MTYEKMLEEINHIPMFGANGGLKNLQAYLDLLDHPESKLRVIHVAGTNGKGSVCAYMESILRNAGYKTALFTSPHLMRFNERFRINFQECDDQLLVGAWERVKELLDRREEYHLLMLTYFEITFLMGMLIFSWEDPDYCIVETGLGGRLDATVLTDPILCIITSISLDHTALLGSTIPEIVREKAGIIKEGTPVLYLDEENGAAQVIEEEACKKHAQVLHVSYRDVTFLKNMRNMIDFSLENRYYKVDCVSVHSLASYQAINASLAMVAIHHILPDLPEESMRVGIAQMYWPGRMEEIAPGIYIDGAHNPGAIEQICQMMKTEQMSQADSEDTEMDSKSLRSDSEGTEMASKSLQADSEDSEKNRQKNRWNLLFAVCADKDYESMISMLAGLDWGSIYITKIETTRGAAVSTVAECFRKYTKAPIYIYEDSKEAFEQASLQKKEDENLLCLGSLYLAGELKKLLGNY